MILGFSGFWWFQWPELVKFKKWNWINFYFCHVAIEAGSYKGKYFELTIVLLGVGFTIEWHDKLTRSRFLADMDQKVAEAKETMGLNDDEEEEWI